MLPTPVPDDEQIVSLIVLAKTNRQAMGSLMELVRPYLLEISNSELAPDLKAKVAASDLVQDSLLEVMRDFPRFGGTTAAEFRAWARTVLLHNLTNWNRWFRGTGKRALLRERSIDAADSDGPAIPLLADGASPSHQIEHDENLQALQDALAELPAVYRQVLELRHWQHLSFAEIGEMTARSSDAARMIWWRAVDRLQELMGRFR
ncbi:MAG: fliA 5 [Planctomycetaceae bacterium]|nr:fliA 5 [Planctomycetaceae bacterium]